jgi:hypothetical protein
MSATPELSRLVARAMLAASADLSPVERGRLARSAERAGTFERLPPKWQRFVKRWT